MDQQPLSTSTAANPNRADSEIARSTIEIATIPTTEGVGGEHRDTARGVAGYFRCWSGVVLICVLMVWSGLVNTVDPPHRSLEAGGTFTVSS